MHVRYALIGAFVSIFPSIALAGPAATTTPEGVGAHLAETVCAACHATTADKSASSPKPDAPRFVDVAAMPSATELSIKVFLRSSHKNMPNLILTEEEINSVTTYILALAKK